VQYRATDGVGSSDAGWPTPSSTNVSESQSTLKLASLSTRSRSPSRNLRLTPASVRAPCLAAQLFKFRPGSRPPNKELAQSEHRSPRPLIAASSNVGCSAFRDSSNYPARRVSLNTLRASFLRNLCQSWALVEELGCSSVSSCRGRFETATIVGTVCRTCTRTPTRSSAATACGQVLSNMGARSIWDLASSSLSSRNSSRALSRPSRRASAKHRSTSNTRASPACHPSRRVCSRRKDRDSSKPSTRASPASSPSNRAFQPALRPCQPSPSSSSSSSSSNSSNRRALSPLLHRSRRRWPPLRCPPR